MGWLLTLTVKLSDSSFSSLGRLPINMYLVFLKIGVRLFTLSHVLILLDQNLF